MVSVENIVAVAAVKVVGAVVADDGVVVCAISPVDRVLTIPPVEEIAARSTIKIVVSSSTIEAELRTDAVQIHEHGENTTLVVVGTAIKEVVTVISIKGVGFAPAVNVIDNGGIGFAAAATTDEIRPDAAI
jgi:hypothetical protein